MGGGGGSEIPMNTQLINSIWYGLTVDQDQEQTAADEGKRGGCFDRRTRSLLHKSG